MSDFAIGDRVVHKLTQGRVRGVVEGILKFPNRTMIVVKVDRTTMPAMNYRSENIVLESEWKE